MSDILRNASFTPTGVWSTNNDSYWLTNFDREAHIDITFIGEYAPLVYVGTRRAYQSQEIAQRYFVTRKLVTATVTRT